MIITGFQLRASRKILNLSFELLSDTTSVSPITLSRLENTIDNYEDISCKTTDAQKLYDYFCKFDLSFPNKKAICLNCKDIDSKDTKSNINRFQFVAARTATKLTLRELGKELNLSHTSLQQFEQKNNNEYLVSYKIKIESIILFFNKKMIFFEDNNSVSLL